VTGVQTCALPICHAFVNSRLFIVCFGILGSQSLTPHELRLNELVQFSELIVCHRLNCIGVHSTSPFNNANSEGGPGPPIRLNCRVERWRGGLGLAYLLTGPFVCRCLTSLAMLRFHLPLIEPDVRISRIRLSEKVHAFACGRREGSHFNWKRPNFSSSHGLQYQRGPEARFRCLRSHQRRNRYRTCELIFR
jgi:hypothetical protein